MNAKFVLPPPGVFGAIALSYPPRVRVRAAVKLSAAFFHDESSITIGGVRKCNSAEYFRMCDSLHFHSFVCIISHDQLFVINTNTNSKTENY